MTIDKFNFSTMKKGILGQNVSISKFHYSIQEAKSLVCLAFHGCSLTIKKIGQFKGLSFKIRKGMSVGQSQNQPMPMFNVDAIFVVSGPIRLVIEPVIINIFTTLYLFIVD